MSETKKLTLSAIVETCRFAAEFLDKIADGEQSDMIDAETIRIVAAGIRDAADNANDEFSRVVLGVVNDCDHYFTCLDVNGSVSEFWDKEIRKSLIKWRSVKVDTAQKLIDEFNNKRSI